MLDVRSWMFDVRRSVLFGSTQNAQRSTSNKEKRVRGIEPPCAAWEAAVLPLNYTRDAISDFRFSIADCNRNKCAPATCGASLPRNHVIGVGEGVIAGARCCFGAQYSIKTERPGDDADCQW